MGMLHHSTDDNSPGLRKRGKYTDAGRKAKPDNLRGLGQIQVEPQEEDEYVGLNRGP